MRSVSSVLWMAIATTWLLGNVAQAQFKDLVRHVPETANALVLVNAQAAIPGDVRLSGTCGGS